MNRCWPLSTSSPFSLKEYARPPRCGFLSSTSTLRPLSASATAHESPAKPPPSTMTSGVSEPMAVEPGLQREERLAPAGQARLLEQHAELARLDLVEEALIDVGHRL